MVTIVAALATLLGSAALAWFLTMNIRGAVQKIAGATGSSPAATRGRTSTAWRARTSWARSSAR